MTFANFFQMLCLTILGVMTLVLWGVCVIRTLHDEAKNPFLTGVAVGGFVLILLGAFGVWG